MHRQCKTVPRMKRIRGEEAVALLALLVAAMTTACGEVAPGAANQGGDGTPRGGTTSPPVDVRIPKNFVVTGRTPELGFSLDVGGYPLSLNEIVELVRPAVTVNDAMGNPVPVRLKFSSVSSTDSSGVAIMTTFEVVSETPQPADAWYTLSVTPIPGKVTTSGASAGFTVNGYTGDLVYFETASRVERLVIFLNLEFTEPFDFDASWATTLFQDADGAPLSACVQAADGCVTSGKSHASTVGLYFASGGDKISRWNPGVMNVAYGHPGGIRTAPGSDAAPSHSPAPDGTLPIEFHQCPWAAQCVQF